MGVPRFVIERDSAAKYRWRLVDAAGKTVADSRDDGYERPQSCHAAIALLKTYAAAAPVVGATPGEVPRGARLRFALQTPSGGVTWKLVGRNGRLVAASSVRYPSREMAMEAIVGLPELIEEAPVTTTDPDIQVPTTCSFGVEPLQAAPGTVVTLTPLIGSSFFTASGTVKLTTPGGGAVATLTDVVWGADKITAKVPGDVANGAYLVVIESALAKGQSPLSVLAFCDVEVTNPPHAWGQPIVLRARLGSFGSAPGRVFVESADGLQSERLPASSVVWGAQQITATLPAAAPFPSVAFALRVEGSAVCKGPLVFDPRLEAQVRTTLKNALARAQLQRATSRESARRPRRMSQVDVGPEAARLALTVAGIPESIPVASQSVPVEVTLGWSVTDANGSPLGTDRVRHLPAALDEPTADVAFAFAPRPAPWTDHLPEPDHLNVTARVRATVAGISEEVHRTLAVRVGALRIPRVVGLFTHAEYGKGYKPGGPKQWVALIAPDGPAPRELLNVLTTIGKVLITLSQTFKNPGPYWLPGAGDVARELSRILDGIALNSVVVEAGADQIPELHKIEFEWFYTAEDTCSSLFFLGLQGNHAAFYRTRHYGEWDDHSRFKLRIPDGQILVTVWTLHVPRPPAWPTYSLAACSPVDPENYGNKLSSMHFGWSSPKERRGRPKVRRAKARR